MPTLDSENISCDNSSTDNVLRRILKIRKTDGSIKKPLYDFNSVEHIFNVKLVRKSPLNNNSGPSIGEESSTNNSNTPIQANQETNTSIPPGVIEIMLPVKVPFKSIVSNALEELPRSNKEEIPFTPIQLFKYSRFNRSKLHNFSTPKGSSKTSLFTCPISPVGKDLVKLNMRDKHNITAQPAEKSHIKEDNHKSNQNISPDNSGYCCFHNRSHRSSNQKTITKSKYMSLGSMKNTKMSPLAFNSKTVEGTMGMSVSNVTRRPSNPDMFNDTSSSGGSEEIPDINVETSFYLSRTLIDIDKEFVQRLHIGPSQSRFLQPPVNDNIEQNKLSEESSTSSVSSIGYTNTDSINLLGNVVNPQNGNEVVKLVEAPLLNAPIAQYDVIATEEIEDIPQPLDNNNVEHNLLTEESDSMSESIVGFSNMDESTNELGCEGNLQKDPNLAKLAQNDITATEEVESIIQPPVNNNVQQNLVPEESDYSGGSVVGCSKMDISINEFDYAGNLQKDINLAKMDEATLTNVPIPECSNDITEEELRRSSKENLQKDIIDKENENEIAINQGVKNVEKPPRLTEELKNTKNIDPKSPNLRNQTFTGITESCKSTLVVTEQAQEARVNCISESLNLHSTVRSTPSLRQSTRWKKQDLISNTNQKKLSKKKEVDKNVAHREMLQRCNTTIAGKSVNADTRSSMLSSRTDLGIIQYASRVPVNHGQSKSTADCTVGVRHSSRLKTIDGSKPSSSTLVKAKLKSSIAVVKSDEQLSFMMDTSHRNSRSLKSNHKSGSGQPKLTVDCPVEVRQSARLKKIAGSKPNSGISEAKRKSFKTAVNSNSKPILETSSKSCRTMSNEQLPCITDQSRSPRSPKAMDVYWTNHKSGSRQPKSTVDCTVEVEHSPHLKTTAGSNSSYSLLTKAKLKSSKAIVKSDSEPIDEILNKICTIQPNSSPRLPCLTDSQKSSRSRKSNDKSRSGQLKSTMNCTVEVRQSARLKKLVANPDFAIPKAKQRSSKAVAKRSSKPFVKILKNSCRAQRNTSPDLNKSLADATSDEQLLYMTGQRRSHRLQKPMYAYGPNHKSGSQQPISTVDCTVEMEHSPHLKATAGSKPSSSVLTKAKLKSSKAIIKTDSEPIDEILNKICTDQPNSSPRLNKSFNDPTSDGQQLCMTGPRRSSRSPKPMHAYWISGLRPIIPVIRDIKQLAATNSSPRLPCLTDSQKSSRSRKSNDKSRSGQLKSTMNCTVEVRQSARLKKLVANPDFAIPKAKQRSSKAVAKRSSKPFVKILKNSCRAQRNTSPDLNKSLADATSDEQLLYMTGQRRSHRSQKPMYAYGPNHKSGSQQPISTVDCTVEMEHSPHLKATAGSKPSSSVLTKAKLKSSKAIVKTDSEPIDEILNKICTDQPNSSPRLNKSFNDPTSDGQQLCMTGPRRSSRSPKPMHAYWISGLRPIIPVIRDIKQLAATNSSPRLPCLTDSQKSSRSRKSNDKSRSGQLKSTMNCTVEVRQSARLKKLVANPDFAIPKAKQRSSKAVAKRSSKPFVKILKNSCRAQRNTSPDLNKSLADATSDEQLLYMTGQRRSHRSQKPMYAYGPNHKSGSQQPISTVDCTVEMEHSPHLKATAGSKPSSSVLTKAKLKSSKAIVKTDSEPIDEILNKICTDQPNSSPRLNKSFNDPTSDGQQLCMTGPRRSSRSPKPMHAYWISGLRPIIPVIRDIKQLADHYDSKIPIILLPPKQLSNKAMSNLLNKINDRMVFRRAYGTSMRY